MGGEGVQNHAKSSIISQIVWTIQNYCSQFNLETWKPTKPHSWESWRRNGKDLEAKLFGGNAAMSFCLFSFLGCRALHRYVTPKLAGKPIKYEINNCVAKSFESEPVGIEMKVKVWTLPHLWLWIWLDHLIKIWNKHYNGQL